MNLRGKVFNFFVNNFITLFKLNKPGRLKSIFYEKIVPVYELSNSYRYKFYCPNSLTRWRADTFFTKEPETLEWIDSFDKEDILFDIGANVGLYSIYAAIRGCNVVAFEPESQNYAILNYNIFLNKLGEKATALNLALSDSNTLDHLFLSDFKGGSALHNFGEAKNWKHEVFSPAFNQGIIAFGLDDFLEKFKVPFPSHIKIDVDGIEAKIIRGAVRTLKNQKLKSLLIELNETLPEDNGLIKIIEDCGLKLKTKIHSALVENENCSSYNYIFIR